MMPTMFQTYAEFVKSRAKELNDKIMNILHGAVGYAGEAGECLDAVKKCWVYNQPLDEQKIENIIEECGDGLFYIQHMLNQVGLTLEDAMKQNMLKLQKRYPAGYSDQAAKDRLDKQPGNVQDA